MPTTARELMRRLNARQCQGVVTELARIAEDMVFVGNPEDRYRPVCRCAIVRATDGEVLGVVGAGHRVVQNEDAFSWCDELLGQDD